MKVRVVTLDDYSESFDLYVKPFRARNDQFVFGFFRVRGTYVLQIFGLGGTGGHRVHRTSVY